MKHPKTLGRALANVILEDHPKEHLFTLPLHQPTIRMPKFWDGFEQRLLEMDFVLLEGKRKLVVEYFGPEGSRC